MRIKTVIAVFIAGVTIAFSAQFIAALDGPHNESNTMNCGDCHGETLLNSPFWNNSDDYDQLCQRCHTGIPITYAAPHANRQCRDCHNPHYQRQKYYKNTDANNLYLATGKITSCDYNPPAFPEVVGTSTLTYDPLLFTYKSGWDSAKLIDKTEKGGSDKRSAVLLPNVRKLGYIYPIVAVDTPAPNTITVKGDACATLSTPPTTFAAMYGQYIRDKIDVSTDRSDIYSQVKFFDKKGQGSFAYDESETGTDSTPNGVCQVCHTDLANPTNPGYWRADGTGADHYNNYHNVCTYCHPHAGGFEHGGGAPCEDCHGHEDDWHTGGPYFGTTLSHSTHTENDADDLKGPFIICSNCHDTNNYPKFKTGTDTNGDGKYNLTETDVCNTCHSKGGAFDGVDDSVIGAKPNWNNGVYQGSPIMIGKEKWCASCHDNVPAVVNGNTAPDIAGDNSSYGYYMGKHGNSSSGVKRTAISYPKGECLHCHDVTKARTSHKVLLFADLDDPDFCMECHTDSGSVQEGGVAGAPGNIKTAFQKTYRHNVTGYSGLHKFSPADETRAYLSANKHVECNDCHNPHAAKTGLHSSNQVHVAARTNLISDSGPLTGGLGAEPTWSGSNWGGATAWPATTSTATKEYQICFKCHANYNTNYSSWGGADEASWTNVALEFNPKNQSYHPVVQTLSEIDPGYEYWSDYDVELDGFGSNRLPPAFISLVIGDSGKSTSALEGSITDSTKNWTVNQWQNWGLRIGTMSTLDSSNKAYNGIKRITSNTSTQLSFDQIIFPSPQSTNTTYSIEYYAGRSAKSGTTVTDTNKNFTLYLPSLVGYIVVVADDCGLFSCGSNVAKGTVISNTATSFTVDSWTVLNGAVPADGTVGYYFSATGKSMMCSDCHSNDTISSTAAQGPHGSAVKWMLKGRNRAWPTTSALNNGTGTGTLFTIGKMSSPATHRSLNDGTVNGLFCLNCHSTVSFSKNAAGLQNGKNVHIIHSWPAGPACINCHIIVPHGSSESRLIGNITMPARYSFNNNTSNMYMTYFRKIFDASHTGRAGDPADYGPQGTKQNCFTVGASVGCHHAG